MSDAGGGGWTPIDHGSGGPSTPPGWYPDPWGSGGLRWWDGKVWSAHTQPTAWVSTPTVSGPPLPPPPGAKGSPWWTANASSATPSRSSTAPLVAVGVVVVAIALLAIVVSRQGTSVRRVDEPSAAAPQAVGTVPPGVDPLDDRAGRAGIPVLTTEGAATHTHSFLRLAAYSGPYSSIRKEVALPSGVGIEGRRIAAVHTHDSSGIVHVESPRPDDRYTVGQFLTLLTGETEPDRVCAAFIPAPCRTYVYGAEAGDLRPEELETLRDYAGPSAPAPLDLHDFDSPLAQGAAYEVRFFPAP